MPVLIVDSETETRVVSPCITSTDPGLGEIWRKRYARTPEMEAVDGVCPPPGSRNISHYASLSLSQKAWQAYGMNIGLNPKTQAMAEDIVQRLDPLNKTKITKPASRLATEIWVEKRISLRGKHYDMGKIFNSEDNKWRDAEPGDVLCRMSIKYIFPICSTCCCSKGISGALIETSLVHVSKRGIDSQYDENNCKRWFAASDGVARGWLGISKAVATVVQLGGLGCFS